MHSNILMHLTQQRSINIRCTIHDSKYYENIILFTITENDTKNISVFKITFFFFYTFSQSTYMITQQHKLLQIQIQLYC